MHGVQNSGGALGGEPVGGVATSAAAASTSASGSAATRTVQETDLYRIDGDRLYYLNAYRGLMVFDVTNVDQPKLLGRSPIFGTPVDMIVNAGIATVVVGDWYGAQDDGAPFHGSVVRGLDATDPTNIRVLGDARIRGWVQEDRVVGNVLYTVSQDYSWYYGWGASNPAASGSNERSEIVSSVNFANGQVRQVSSQTYPLVYGGIINVTASAILFAHDVDPRAPALDPGTRTELDYLDISDPGGQIVERGRVKVDGVISTSGADGGRWSLDFADGKTAHVIGCDQGPNDCGVGVGSYVLATADFSNPDAPVVASHLAIPSPGWKIATRFDTGRMYLAPDPSNYSAATAPVQVFDLSNPAAPVLAGQTTVQGNVWWMVPSGNQLFALGIHTSADGTSTQLSLSYFDVTDARSPTPIGTSTFAEGFASTPAQSTFKAVTMDASRGLVLLPFSGWDAPDLQYRDGVQLIEFTPSSITTAGAAHTTGSVERGIFVKNRLVSLSDLALSVIDYSNPLAPAVTGSLTLARNVATAQPSGSTIAEISSDWWDNDVSHSEVRVLPIVDAEERADESGAIDTSVEGTNAKVFKNGTLDYIVTNVRVPIPCESPVSTEPYPGPVPSSGAPQCIGWIEQVQVVDLANGGAKLRGKIALPMGPDGGNTAWGWSGFYDYDWFNGSEIVQVNGSTLAFRRWNPAYINGRDSSIYVDPSSDLFVVDLANPDAPTVAALVITRDPTGWWGNMRVVGSTLYTSHVEWTSAVTAPSTAGDAGAGDAPAAVAAAAAQPTVRFYLDRIDLGEAKHPKIGSRINVPGVIVGGSPSDPSILYTIDYAWDANRPGEPRDSFDVVKVSGDLAYLQSATDLDGYVGNVIVRGATAYRTSEIYYDRPLPGQQQEVLHQIDLSNPSAPVDRVISGPLRWGWLLDVQGDRAMVTSGWGQDGLDVYRLSDTAPPVFDRFVRTRGWSVNSLSRQDNQLFLASGYWGVQAVTLQ